MGNKQFEVRKGDLSHLQVIQNDAESLIADVLLCKLVYSDIDNTHWTRMIVSMKKRALMCYDHKKDYPIIAAFVAPLDSTCRLDNVCFPDSPYCLQYTYSDMEHDLQENIEKEISQKYIKLIMRFPDESSLHLWKNTFSRAYPSSSQNYLSSPSSGFSGCNSPDLLAPRVRKRTRSRSPGGIYQKICTLSNNRESIAQFRQHCNQCDIWCCLNCATICHKSHDLTKLEYSALFKCECGIGGCSIYIVDELDDERKELPSPSPSLEKNDKIEQHTPRENKIDEIPIQSSIIISEEKTVIHSLDDLLISKLERWVSNKHLNLISQETVDENSPLFKNDDFDSKEISSNLSSRPKSTPIIITDLSKSTPIIITDSSKSNYVTPGADISQAHVDMSDFPKEIMDQAVAMGFHLEQTKNLLISLKEQGKSININSVLDELDLMTSHGRRESFSEFKVFSYESEEKSFPNSSSSQSLTLATKESKSRYEKLNDEFSQLVDEDFRVSICIICAKSEISALILECAHLAMCYDCASKISTAKKKCPICLAPITSVIRTYS